jgi:hypothetical protein
MTHYDAFGLPVEHEIERAVRRMVEHPQLSRESSMITIVRATTDGHCSLHQLDISTPDSGLLQMQGLIGGYVEVFGLNGGGDLWVDEDGVGKDLELNTVGMLMVQHTGTAMMPGDYIKGTCLIIGSPTEAGDLTSVPEATIAWLKRSQITTWPDA